MIPKANILEWQKEKPWPNTGLVEHDLVLSRAICELYKNSVICEELVFRGGTALQKLFFSKAGRFSEDLDFVQITAKPIGPLTDAIRSCLDYWLGEPSWKQNSGRFTLIYNFQTEMEPISKRKVKIEINTREHFSVNHLITKKYIVANSWFSGSTNVLCYSFEELLGTKLRALYQRKKGRDLYDLWYSMAEYPELDTGIIVDILQQYMSFESKTISRAEFERNLFYKKSDRVFINDIFPLLSAEYFKKYNIEQSFATVQDRFISKLPGKEWKGLEPLKINSK